MAQKINHETGLIYPENYGMYAGIAYGEYLEVHTADINIANWNEHYRSLLNIFKDGIDSPSIHSMMINVVFVDGIELSLSLFDYFINLIMWYTLVASNTKICGKHVFFAKEITQNTIKNYIDEFLIEENRKKISNVVLNNIIDDTLNKFHDIDLFALYLSNTLCLEDSMELAKADPEFRECMNADFSGIPLEDVKDVGMKYANKSIDIIKNRSKDILGHDHCLADAFRAQQGVNTKQYKEFQIGIGTKPDGQGGVYPAIINRSFINGGVTDPMDYFIESSTGRTAQIIKLKNVGTSGQFARNLGLNNMDSKLRDDPNHDCRSNNFIKITINSKKALSMLNNRYYRLNPNGIDHIIRAKKDIHLLGKTIYLRSPVTCASAAAGKGICYKCYGDLAYTLFDTQQNFGINIGRIASEILSSELTQRLLSAKHLLETSITKITWCNEFSDFFEISDNIIKIAPELDYKDLKLQIDPECIELENDEDSDLSDDEDSSVYNEYITSFDVVKVSTGEEFHIYNDKNEQLFITNELNTVIRKKGEPIDGKISIGFNELKESYLFVMQIENNELTKTLKNLLDILNKKPVTQSYPSVSDLYQDLIDTTIEGGLNIAATHLEVILMNQIRDTEDMFGRPRWWEHNPPYNIITLNEALTNNPSVVISLSYQKIKRQFFNPLTFKKHGPSFMDLFFMETPQRVIYNIEEEEKFVRKPGELVDPIIPIDDASRVTMAISEELDSEDID